MPQGPTGELAMDTTSREQVTRSLRRLFISTASLVILSVVCGTVLLASVIGRFGTTVDGAQEWSDRIDSYSALNTAVHGISAAANGIFVTRDVEREQAKLRTARATFDLVLADRRNELDGRRLSNAADLQAIRVQFDRLASTVDRLDSLAGTGITLSDGGQVASAAESMASMNKVTGDAQAILGQITTIGLDAQQRLLASGQTAAARTRALAIPLAAAAMLAVAAVLVLSRLTGKRLQGIAVEREGMLDALERNTTDLRAFNRKLSESNRDLTDFAYVASHDLQEPLRKIIAFGDRLQSRCSEQLGPDGLDYLARMQNAAGRMQTLIQDLLTFSRVTTRGEAFLRTDLRNVVTGVIGDLEVAVERADATIEIGELPSIDVDPSQFRQLVQNLVGNALKFRRSDVATFVGIKASLLSGPDAVEMLAAYPEGGQWWRIEIRDNGIGFEQKYADKIFTVFQRLHGRSDYEGSGVGLAVCRRIVERHRGRIHATSTVGSGAVFEIVLPSIQIESNPHDLGAGIERDFPAPSREIAPSVPPVITREPAFAGQR
jgi:signal transduction histidine kinase